MEDIIFNDAEFQYLYENGLQYAYAQYDHKRFSEWCLFLSRFEVSAVKGVDVILWELTILINQSRSLNNQPGIEFELSKKLLTVFFENQNFNRPYSDDEIRGALVLALIFGKYYQDTRRSIDGLPTIFSSTLHGNRVILAISWLFEKYPIPTFLYERLALLDDAELHLMVELMKGKKIKEYQGVPITKRDLTWFWQYPFLFFFDTGTIPQVILQIRIYRICKDVNMTTNILRCVKKATFKTHLTSSDIVFWQEVAKLTLRLPKDLHLDYSHFIDYYSDHKPRLSFHLSKKVSLKKILEEIDG